jgi:uncharacterized protein
MSASLLDVNVLIALFDPGHPNHDDAHAWFGSARRHAWATCPVTVNGVVRILSSNVYPSFEASPAEVITRLRAFCSSPKHQFWETGVSLLDPTLFRHVMIAGHKQVTDIYLLGLAIRRQGKLATFDRSIPIRTVIGAEPRHLELLG